MSAGNVSLHLERVVLQSLITGNTWPLKSAWEVQKKSYIVDFPWSADAVAKALRLYGRAELVQQPFRELIFVLHLQGNQKGRQPWDLRKRFGSHLGFSLLVGRGCI